MHPFQGIGAIRMCAEVTRKGGALSGIARFYVGLAIVAQNHRAAIAVGRAEKAQAANDNEVGLRRTLRCHGRAACGSLLAAIADLSQRRSFFMRRLQTLSLERLPDHILKIKTVCGGDLALEWEWALNSTDQSHELWQRGSA